MIDLLYSKHVHQTGNLFIPSYNAKVKLIQWLNLTSYHIGAIAITVSDSVNINLQVVIR